MKVGVSIGVFDEEHLRLTLRGVKDSGLKMVELCSGAGSTWPEFLRGKKVHKVKMLLQSLGLEAVLHAVDQGVNLASLNPIIRRESIRQVKESIELATRLGTKVVTIHPGERLLGIFRKESWETFLFSLEECCICAQSAGVLLGLENRPYSNAFCRFIPEIQGAFMKVTSKSLGVTLDIGHANVTGVFTPLDFITELGTKIINVHVSDNNGMMDRHKPLGQGNIQIEQILKALRKMNYNGPLIIEVRGDGFGWEKAVIQSRDILLLNLRK